MENKHNSSDDENDNNDNNALNSDLCNNNVSELNNIFESNIHSNNFYDEVIDFNDKDRSIVRLDEDLINNYASTIVQHNVSPFFEVSQQVNDTRILESPFESLNIKNSESKNINNNTNNNYLNSTNNKNRDEINFPLKVEHRKNQSLNSQRKNSNSSSGNNNHNKGIQDSVIYSTNSTEEEGYYLERSEEVSGSPTLYSLCYRDPLTKKYFRCCKRRYSHFEAFRECLRYFFPSFIIPKLPPKDFINSKLKKLVISNEAFNLERFKGLNFFFKTISNIIQIKESAIFAKFTTEQNINESSFNTENFISILGKNFDTRLESCIIAPSLDIPKSIAVLNSQSSFTQFFKSIYSNITSSNVTLRQVDGNEGKINEIREVIKNKYKTVESIKVEMISFLEFNGIGKKDKKTEISYLFDFGKELEYIQDYSFIDKNASSILEEQIVRLTTEPENKDCIMKFNKNINDEARNFLLELEGVLDLFYHYDEINSNLEIVLKAIKISSDSNWGERFLEELRLEMNKVTELRKNYELNLAQNIENYLLKYRENFSKFINKFNLCVREFTRSI